MATTKVKGTSKKIKELKGIEDIRPETITDEQLKKVQSTVNQINRTQLEIGSMEVKKHELMHGIAGLRDELTLLQNEFEKDYGTFDINIEDGTINYPKENGEVNKKD
jgi:ppGpp synthetase/RelA/SpoT-type nucleotidyltranferase|tara:strand:- start:13 stop:333 length:321 start_codon:yes stop_codon:yes gene_type:complete